MSAIVQWRAIALVLNATIRRGIRAETRRRVCPEVLPNTREIAAAALAKFR
jgi:hypothetical protein